LSPGAKSKYDNHQVASNYPAGRASAHAYSYGRRREKVSAVAPDFPYKRRKRPPRRTGVHPSRAPPAAYAVLGDGGSATRHPIDPQKKRRGTENSQRYRGQPVVLCISGFCLFLCTFAVGLFRTHGPGNFDASQILAGGRRCSGDGIDPKGYMFICLSVRSHNRSFSPAVSPAPAASGLRGDRSATASETSNAFDPLKLPRPPRRTSRRSASGPEADRKLP
jgi:hypothetical protein